MGKLNIVYFTFLVATCLVGFSLAEFRLTSDKAEQVRTQIELEMTASLFYQSYGHFFEHSKQALHGFAQFFFEQSLEEKKHADKLMTYLNKRGNRVKKLGEITNICEKLQKEKSLCNHIIGGDGQVPYTTITEAAKMAVRNALELEKTVYDSLDAITQGSKADAQLSHFIEHEFLDEQVESIKEFEDYKSQLEQNGEHYVGLLLIDRWLMERKKTEL